MNWEPVIEHGMFNKEPRSVTYVRNADTEDMVCECYEGSDEERIAYARLIAAAPDLLKALTSMRDILNSAGYATTAADAAIAKATGGQS